MPTVHKWSGGRKPNLYRLTHRSKRQNLVNLVEKTSDLSGFKDTQPQNGDVDFCVNLDRPGEMRQKMVADPSLSRRPLAIHVSPNRCLSSPSHIDDLIFVISSILTCLDNFSS